MTGLEIGADWNAAEKGILAAIKAQAEKLGMTENRLDIEILDIKGVTARDPNADEEYISIGRMVKGGLIAHEHAPTRDMENYLVRIFDIERKTDLKDFFAMKRAFLL